MYKKIRTTFVLLIFLTSMVMVSASSTTVSVGVKKGDYVEYNVTYTGTPPEGHAANWARVEVLDVTDSEISVNITARAPNGTLSSQVSTLNLQAGELGDDFIVPANLNVDDVFFDARDGNITIGSQVARTYAGASREVVTGNMRQAFDYWDKSTGFVLEGTSTLADYTMVAKIDKTNLWENIQSGLEQTFWIVGALVVIIIVVAAVILLASHRKK